MSGLASYVRPHSSVFTRAAREGLRDPGPSMLLPALPAVLQIIAFTALFGSLSSVIDFPTGSFEEYFIPGAVMFVGVAGGGFSSGQVAADISAGFIDRLRLQTSNVSSLLLGRFGFEAVRVLPGAALVVGVGLLFGGTASNGIAGVVAIVVLTMLTSAAWSGIYFVVSILSGNPQTPLNLQPLGIIIGFLSSAFITIESMPSWAEGVSKYNPFTVIVDGGREAMIGELASSQVANAFGVAALGCVISLLASTFVLRQKLSKG